MKTYPERSFVIKVSVLKSKRAIKPRIPAALKDRGYATVPFFAGTDSSGFSKDRKYAIVRIGRKTYTGTQVKRMYREAFKK